MGCLNKKLLSLQIASILYLVLLPQVRVRAQTNLVDSSDEVGEVIEEVVERNFSIEDFIEGALAFVPEVIDRAEEIIESINEGDYEDAFYGVKGVIGLFDPQKEANTVAISNDSIYSNPESPQETDRMGQAADVQQSQVSQRLSQIIFSDLGQEAIAEQNEILIESQQGASEAQEATVTAVESVEEIIDSNIAFADDITSEADEAQRSRASQDVLKALASQSDYEAQILLGISEQLGVVTQNQVYNSVQMKSLNTQLTVANQREQNIQTFLASNGLQLSEIDNNIEQQIELLKQQNRKKILRSQTGMTKIFIPNLYSEEGETEED